MVTKRTAIARRYTASVSERAVELYLAMKRIRCGCEAPPPGRIAPSPQCAACERWWNLHSELDEALGPTKPWLWPHLPPPTRLLHSDGSIRPRQPLEHQRELAARLREAARAQRNAQGAAQPEQPTPAAPSG
jgi:hypothetical protein